MIRRVFTIGSLLSLLLCAAAAALWVRSYWFDTLVEHGGGLTTSGHWDSWDLHIHRGMIGWGADRYSFAPEQRDRFVRGMMPAIGWRVHRWPVEPGPWAFGPLNLLGFVLAHDGSDFTPGAGGRLVPGDAPAHVEVYDVTVPFWFPVMLLLVLPSMRAVAWIRSRRQRRRRLRRLCSECGYDLRASNGRCPECGMAIPAEW